MSEETKPKKQFALSPSISILIAGVLIAGAIIFVNQHPATPVVADNENLPTNVDVPAPSADDHIIGSPTASIVLVEYSDFQCYYCGQAHPTFKRLVEEGKGNVAWVMRNLPLTSIHPQAKPSALAAECIAEQLGNDGFWKFADKVFANQDKMTPAYYAQIASELGADPTQYASCVSSEKYWTKIQAEAAEAQANGASGTPFTVLVGNGLQVPISGALPYEQFVAVIKAINDRQ
ncbi:thioredoxin domain-containing protein [Acetobacteraceae bacterium]|nr:thioredoxin domain-containing protein [Candidatus Parcubacteria bacterium]